MSHEERSSVQNHSKFGDNFQFKLVMPEQKKKKKKCQARFSLDLQGLPFKEKSKVVINSCLTNSYKWQYIMLITRGCEPCGSGLCM